MSILVPTFFLLVSLSTLPDVRAVLDATLETDTQSLTKVYFSLGGPGWQRRGGWEVLELAQDQFVDVFDVDGNQVLSPQEIKEGLNVNYVGCRFPPCYPTLTVHNPLFKIAEPANRYYLEEFGFTDSEVQALVVKATSERTDPIRGQAKINARDKSLDGLVLFKEFFSTFIAADPCLDGWYGVTCSDQGRVIGLSLQSNQLTGIIPPDIGNLTLLRGLHLGSKDRSSLSSNYIMGEIPSTISQMFQLQSLSLDHNLLTGSIPDAIGTLTSLTVLDLSWNRLNGPLPNITGLKELSRLFIDHNYLNGTVNELSELTKLEEVDISNNDLEGDLQAPLLGLPLLQSAYFHANPKARLNAQFSPLSPGLSAQYANQLGRANNAVLVQDKAVLLDLYQSSGGGGWFIRFGWEEPLSDPCLSSWYGVECDDAGRVISLLLNGNNLTGLLPRSIGHLAMLSTVNLAKNQLRGTIPPEIASLARLRYLDLSSNQLVGTIPAQLGGARELEMLLLNDNFLTGSLPPVADGAWTRIRNLNLARNRMQGSLPASLGALRSIEYLDLSSNLLVGTLPGSMGSMRSLKELRMEDNQLRSELPPQWAGMSELRMLNLARNRLHGRIPGEWGPGMKSLRFLVLYSNRLSGEIPPSLFSMKLLQQVVLSSNQLTGGIPSSILRVSGTLSLLDLRDNKLSGNLPSSLANLSQLLFLDLSSNSFSGFLPDYFNTSSHFLLLDRWGKVRLASNDFACPVPSQGAARTATCSTRNCPLDWVSNGTSCVKCSPGYSRRRGMERCSRCGQVGREEEERLCAVFSSDWQRVMTKQNDTSGAVKCILCSQAAALNLYVLPEMDAQSLQAESTGGGHEAQREVLTYNGSSAYPDGARYVGEVMLGAPHGRGTMTSRRGLYIGSFVSGKRSGRGTFTTVEGDEYGGEWGDGGRFFDNTGTNWGGVLNGKGYARYRSNAMVALRAILKGVMQPEEVGTAGGTYEGEWFDGEWEGMGSFSTANGDVYLGEFHRGKYHGRGMQEQQLGGFYKGWWQEGRKEGNGTMFYANGDIYEGGWLRDARHGWGKMWFWDGRLYEGYWRFGLKHGWGRETIQRTGQVFEGRWQDGLRYGHGVIHYGNGDAFSGNFVDDERQGDGVMHYADPNFRDAGADLKASFMFGEPRNAFKPIVVQPGNLTAGSITMYVPQDANQIADTALEYWGISNTNYLVGTGYAGTG